MMAPSLFRRCWLLSILFAICHSACAIELIANAKAETRSLSFHQLRALFSGQIVHWPNGLPVALVVMDDSNDLHVQFSKQILNIYPYQLRRIWDRLMYSGMRPPPIVVSTDEEMLRVVSAIPGAIGYIPSARSLPDSIAQLAVAEPQGWPINHQDTPSTVGSKKNDNK